ncbi:uncharacterized protein LOC126841004 isoform X2 [Adelges cooleyi]|uniref:uncharacterized protein LOC126841004 isoform X2 n=1 Tax=Adelges cooleyi TaxID=133065 RepID=UPI00217FA8D2|nr:uncharacterized protein LOC126841004 isoform X2 [Adelges cooleyi]XP_050433080.1 uncharacterized protein LOC126841004 isoform X2 [Adelges cooleyi]
MYLGSCIILLCLGYFHISAMLLVNASGENSQAMDSRMRKEFQRIYPQNDVAESSSSGSNNQLVIVGPRTPDGDLYFNPVDQFWQYEKCRQFEGVQLENYFQFNQTVKILNSPSQWVQITPDRHGFYRALSQWMSGTDKHHQTIRQRVQDIVRTDQRILNFLGEIKHRSHLFWISQDTWATEVEIIASTFLLDTPIYVYENLKQAWVLFDQNRTHRGPLKKTDKFIYLQHVSEIHYNLVTDVKSDQVVQNTLPIVRCQPAEIRFFYPVEEHWQFNMCNKWKLSLEKPFQFNRSPTILSTPKECVEIQKGKNCFFRALSYCVTGTEHHHQLMRKYVAMEIFFNRAIQKLYETNEFISFSTININWATKIEIIASAVLLNTSIFVYSNVTRTWDVYNRNIIDNSAVDTATARCIYLMQVSPNQYDVVKDIF